MESTLAMLERLGCYSQAYGEHALAVHVDASNYLGNEVDQRPRRFRALDADNKHALKVAQIDEVVVPAF